MTATPSSRFASVRGRLLDPSSKLPPLRTTAVGDVALGIDLAAAMVERLGPDDVHDVWGDETDKAAELLRERPHRRRRRLVRWWDIDQATPDARVLGSARSMRSVRGTWLLAVSTQAAPRPFSDAGAWDLRVGLTLSPAERLAWVQGMLGGVPQIVAQAVVDRVGTSSAALRAASSTVRAVVDTQATVDDVAALVPLDAGRDYVDAVLTGDRRGALGSAPGVLDPHRALAVLQWRLLDVWALSEMRPPVATRPARDVVADSGLPRWVADQLIPLARSYPRARVGECLDALAVAQVGLRQAPDQAASVLAVLAALWCQGR